MNIEYTIYLDSVYNCYYITIDENDLEHREDGPSTIWAPGDREEYFYYGKTHRLDGPAYVFVANSAFNEWWYQDQHIKCSSQEEFEKLVKLIHFI